MSTPTPPASPTPTPILTPTPTVHNPRSVVSGPPLAVSPRKGPVDLASATYPTPGDGDVNFWIPFSWPFSPGATSYVLLVGTAPGAGDVFDSGEILSTSVTVPQLSAGSYFARIGTNTAGTWSFRDFTFGSTGIPIATLVSPVSGSVLASAATTFTWQSIPGATSYRLLLGTSFGRRTFDSVSR